MIMLVLFFSLIYPINMCADNELNSEYSENCISINRNTHLTFRRYYFISRLDKTIRLLLKIQTTNHTPFTRSVRSPIDMSLFNDQRILLSLERIQETRSLKPLFMIWDDFVSYKSLEDDVFIEDFSKEIFVITRDVLSSFNREPLGQTEVEGLHTFMQPSPSHKTEELFNAIDSTTEELEKIIPLNKHIPFQTIGMRTMSHPPLDLKQSVSTDEIALRFYYLQRLSRSMKIITSIKRNPIYRSLNDKWVISHESPYTRSLLKAMQQTSTAMPLVDAWDDMQQYKFVDSIEFVKEFAKVVFIALRHLYGSSDTDNIMMQSGASVDTIDVEDLLQAIDIITDQLSASAHMQDSYNARTSNDWLQHYWWIPPLTIGSIAVKLAHYYYTHN